MPSGLHRTYGAHHLHFITCSCYKRLPFLDTARARDRFLFDSGTDPPALSVRGRGTRGDAGAHSPADHGTGGRDTLYGDAGLETAPRPCFVTQAQTTRPAPAQPVRRRGASARVLAGSFL